MRTTKQVTWDLQQQTKQKMTRDFGFSISWWWWFSYKVINSDLKSRLTTQQVKEVKKGDEPLKKKVGN